MSVPNGPGGSMNRLFPVVLAAGLVVCMAIAVWYVQPPAPGSVRNANPALVPGPGRASEPRVAPGSVQPAPSVAPAPAVPEAAPPPPTAGEPRRPPATITGNAGNAAVPPARRAEPLPPPPRRPLAPQAMTPILPEITGSRSVPVVPAAPPPEAAPAVPAPEPSRTAAATTRSEETVVLRPLGTENDAVQRVVKQYEAAFNRLDVAAAAAVWPSLDQRALARAFSRVESQALDFAGCSVALSGTDATAHCQGTLNYVPRVGRASPHAESHTWIIRLRGAGEEWHILDVRAE